MDLADNQSLSLLRVTGAIDSMQHNNLAMPLPIALPLLPQPYHVTTR